MRLASDTFRDGGVIPGRCGFAIKAPRGKITLGRNRNPELHWSEVPAGTRSLVLTCIDFDAPNPKPADVNTAGAVLSAKLPRGEFVHWLVADIAPTVSGIAEGSCSDGVIARGKRQPAGPQGSLQGLNDYTAWFAGDGSMEGPYVGYDGPCPPWNDSVPHHYQFDLHACNVEQLALGERFTLADLRQALEGHVLATASIIGRYALNPAIRLK